MTSRNKHSVLVVEDERIVAKDLQQTLVEMGYDAFAIASSADEAIARASEKCPDVALMDIRIKGVRDGIETAEILKSRFGIPVIYLTAYADEATIERAKKTEPHGYLLKPVKPAELRSAIEISVYRHAMEKHLREQERWYSTTMRSIADAIVTVDLAGKVTYLNPAAETLIGTKSEEAIGKPAAEILQFQDMRPTFSDTTPLAAALRMRQTVEFEEAQLLNLSTGARRTVADRTAPVLDDDLLLGAVMVFRDITDQKRLQKQLELADRLSSLGTLAAGTAHELNNPLAVVMAGAGVLAEDLEQHRVDLVAGASFQMMERQLGDMAATLRDVQAATSRMARIVADLRTFSRPAEQSSRVIDLAHCVERAIRATSHDIHLRARLRIQFDVSPPPVYADETRLEQVLVNLLVNAAQAIAPGSADRNEITVSTGADQDGHAVIEVRDTGAGIPPDALKRIFEPFFTTKEVGRGTGLGLSICHGIVTAMGGRIEVESEVGKGAAFRILLPPAPVDETGAGAVPDKPQATQLLRGRILVVDDEEMMVRTFERALKRQNHDVASAPGVREALALIERGERFDLILSDLMMPTMTGIEFYERLLDRNPELARRMIFITGGAITAQADAFLQSVTNRQIQKPFRMTLLGETVQQALAEQTAQGEPADRP